MRRVVIPAELTVAVPFAILPFAGTVFRFHMVLLDSFVFSIQDPGRFGYRQFYPNSIIGKIRKMVIFGGLSRLYMKGGIPGE